MNRLAVIGAGVAGLSAAWAARFSESGEANDITLIDGGVGATSLTSGAVDLEPWDAVHKAAKTLGQEPLAQALDETTRTFVDELGIWSVPESGSLPLVCSTGGAIRLARGIDRSLLDLQAIRGRRVLLPRAARSSWDADALQRIYAAEAPPELGLTFEPIDAAVLRFDDERRIADAEIANRHDDPERLEWLAKELRKARSRAGGDVAFLLGPWLGGSAPRAEALSNLVGAPVGEALSGWPGAPGLRFEAARDALLKRRSIEVIRDRVVAVEADGQTFELCFRDDAKTKRFDALVLATGGLIGGGIVFDPSDYGAGPDGADRAHAPYRLDLTTNLSLRVGGLLGTMHGPALDEMAWPTSDRGSPLEHVGLNCNNSLVAPRVFAAGDLVAGRPRTVLWAVSMGIAAGRRASSL